MKISRRHPDYRIVSEEVDFLGRSYVGGQDYRDGAFLDQYPREEVDIYNARLERAYYSNYVAAVVDAYVAEVFRLQPLREVTGDAAQEFIADATGDGFTLTEFLRLSLISALSIRRRYIIVDLDEEGRPYVHAIHPANMLDYSESRDGFNWILVAEQVVDDADPELDRQTSTRYRLWTPEEWRLYDKTAKVESSGPNVAGRVPLVVMHGENTRLPIFDIAEINRRIYNVASQRDEILMKLTFPQFYFQDSENPETGAETRAIELGISRALALPPGSSITPGFLAPPDGPVEQHRKEQEYLVSEIYRLAGLERKDPDEQSVQSGVAKAYDFRETNARLSNAATMCQRTEMEIFQLLDDYGLVGGAYNVTYTKDFNVEAFSHQLENYLKLSEAALPAQVKKEAAKDLVGRLLEERPAEQKRLALDAIESMEDTSFGTESPLERVLRG